MAGGSGTRLWPISRVEKPKQLQSLIEESSLFQSTINRIEPLFNRNNILVVAREELVPKLQAQCPQIPPCNYIVEPEGKGTAPCIGLAGIHIAQRNPEALMVVLASDHHISDTAGFLRVLKAAFVAAGEDHLVTLGISPTHPSTGYGYIKQGEKIRSIAGSDVYRVESFIEKPDKETAVRMMAEGGYSWNSGMFVWKTSRIFEEFHKHMPQLYTQLTNIGEHVGGPEYISTLDQVWKSVPSETIDYGVMEKAEDAVVILSNIGWSDIGSWSSLIPLIGKDDNGNVLKGNVVTLDTHECLILGERRLIASIGVSDLIVVEVGDALLICNKSDDQRVKEIIDILKQEKKHEYL